METDVPGNDPPEKRSKKSKKHSDMNTKDEVTDRSTEHRKPKRHKKAKHPPEVNPTEQPATGSVPDLNFKQYSEAEFLSSEPKPIVPVKKKKKRVRDESTGQKLKSQHKTCETAPVADVPVESTTPERKHESRVKHKSRPAVAQWTSEDQGDTRTVVDVGQAQTRSPPQQPTAPRHSRSGSHNSSKSSVVSRSSRTPPNRGAYAKRTGSPASTSHSYKRTHGKTTASPERRRHSERKPPANYRPRSRSYETSSDDRDAMLQASKHHKRDRSREPSRHYEASSSHARPSSSSHSRGRYRDYSPRRTFRQKYHYRSERSRSRSSSRRRHERHPERRTTPSRQRHVGRDVPRKPHGPDSHGIDAAGGSRHSVSKPRAREAKERSVSALAGESRGKSASPISVNSANSPHRKAGRSNYSGKRPLEPRPSGDNSAHETERAPTERSPYSTHRSVCTTGKKPTAAPSKRQSPTDSPAVPVSPSRSADRHPKGSHRPSNSKVGNVVYLLGELRMESISDTELHDVLPASMFLLASADAPALLTDTAGRHRSSESPNRRRHKHAKQDSKFVSDSCEEDAADDGADKAGGSTNAEGHYRLAADALEKISQLRDKLGGPENWESTDFSLSPSHPSASSEQDTIVDDLLLPADQSLVAMTTARSESSGTQCSQLLVSSLSTPWQELVESAGKALSLVPNEGNEQVVAFKPINTALNLINVANPVPTPNRLLPLSSRANGCLALKLTGVSKKYLGEDLLKCIQQELGQSEVAIPAPTVNSLKTGLTMNERVKAVLDAVLPHGSVLSSSFDRVIRLSLLGEVQ